MLSPLQASPATAGEPAAGAPAEVQARPAQAPSPLALHDSRGIEIEEIGEVEFLREWARAITRVALAQTGLRRHVAAGAGDADGCPSSP